MFSSATKTSAQMTEELAKNDINNKKESIKMDATQKAEKTVEDIADYANQAGRHMRDFVDNAASKIDETNKMMTEEVRNSPMKSILTAVVVGFVLGAMSRRS